MRVVAGRGTIAMAEGKGGDAAGSGSGLGPPDLLTFDRGPQGHLLQALLFTVLPAKDVFLFYRLSFGIEIPPGAVGEVFRVHQFVEQVLHGGEFDSVTPGIEHRMTALFRYACIEQDLARARPENAQTVF